MKSNIPKKIILFSTFIIISILSISGCLDNNENNGNVVTDENTIIGTWTIIQNTAGPTGGTFTFKENNIFNASDGSYGAYEINDNELCLIDYYASPEGAQEICFIMTFSNDNTQISLEYEGEIVMTLSKS